MIFSQYRDSVTEITAHLARIGGAVKPMSFIGKATSSRGNKGVTQKEQIEVGGSECSETYVKINA